MALKRDEHASTGSDAAVEPAIRNPQSTLCSVCDNNASPTGSVRNRSESTKINGNRKEFQLVRNAWIATTASTGFMSGSTMVRKIIQSDAPSTRAASSSSIGSPSTYWRTRKMLNASTANGRISAE